ncbi:patatin-like protein [Streptomyces neyagawaensis]|uniref:patatin-like protein n=1 Tax=Streptomyces neyagawaensis TaxID=42238 RepID=UPI00099E5C78|nr:patatin-like protein [Streptomyces neyagawaensis]MCL6732002.1 patatin-like protein [Streptomyces neyagawaensis]MDE1682506.1 patatin-like protein [Streptomyces neyagawaensis]
MSDDAQPSVPDAELRIAVAFTGGLSLAVWMGGVARELNLLTTAARADASGTPAGLVRARYKRLLDLLRLDVSVDVLSGTSAGGINAALLGLATVRGCDLGGLRSLWLDEGALGTLLRDLDEPRPPSLLQGEERLLRGLETGLKSVFEDQVKGLDRVEGLDPDPTRVFITTTLLDGMPHPFRDDYGSTVHDRDHRGLFRFTATDLERPQIIPALARAARSSASYPVAFEPAYIPAGEPTHQRPDMGPYMVRLPATQFCADGGLLANRPIGPALQAVFDRPATREVRRVLAYVVPSADGASERPAAPPVPDDVPSLGPMVLKVFGIVTSQSISAELSALAAHNERVRSRLRAETRLARMAVRGADLGDADLHREHRAKHVRALARSVAEETLGQMIACGAGPRERPVGFGPDLDRLTAGAVDVIEGAGPLPEALPGDAEVFDALARYGRPLLDAGKATVLRLLRESGAQAPADIRKALEEQAGKVHAAMPARSRNDLRTQVRPTVEAVLGRVPPDDDPVGAVIRTPGWAAAITVQLPTAQDLPDLATAWRTMVDAVLDTRRRFPHGAPGGGDEAPAWQVLLTYLAGTPAGAGPEAGPGDAPPPGAVARRLFDLLAAQRVIFPDETAARQRVELIQMSADTRTLLDDRQTAAQKLTGLQLHHFGAFFKRSWRANDWMWGRLDGAGWLVHVLLSPQRLKGLAAEGVPVGERLREIAGTEAPSGVFTPGPEGEPAELAFLTADDSAPLPASLPQTSMWVALGIQRLIAAEELPCVAEQAEADQKAGGAHAAADFLQRYRRRYPDSRQPVDPDTVDEFLRACRISEETFRREKDSRLLKHTVSHAAVVTANAVRATVDRWSWRLLFGGVSRALRLAHAVRRRT